MSNSTVQMSKQPPTHSYLVVTTTEQAGAIFQLKEGVTNIGRGGNNDVRLDDPAVSTEHARVRCDGGRQFTLIDLGSQNGARLNGRPTQQHVLRHNDVVQLGAARLVFKRVG